jgi:hypothetical protein
LDEKMPIDFTSLEDAVQDSFGGIAATLTTRDASETGGITGMVSVISRVDVEGDDSRMTYVVAELRCKASAAATALGRAPEVRDTFTIDGNAYKIDRVEIDTNNDDVTILRGVYTVRQAEYNDRAVRRQSRE